MTKKKKKSELKKRGRKPVIIPAVVKLLRTAWSFDCSDTDACEIAGISRTSLISYYKKNPELKIKRNQLKKRAVLAAKKKVVSEIPLDVEVAKWYLERKCRKEFGPVQKVDINTDSKVQHSFNIDFSGPEDDKS